MKITDEKLDLKTWTKATEVLLKELSERINDDIMGIVVHLGEEMRDNTDELGIEQVSTALSLLLLARNTLANIPMRRDELLDRVADNAGLRELVEKHGESELDEMADFFQEAAYRAIRYLQECIIGIRKPCYCAQCRQQKLQADRPNRKLEDTPAHTAAMCAEFEPEDFGADSDELPN